MNRRITHVIDNTITTAKIATSARLPYADSARLKIVVVIAPGPTSSGIAIGTAPKLSGDSTFSCMLPETKILTEIINSKMPPAISKL